MFGQNVDIIFVVQSAWGLLGDFKYIVYFTIAAFVADVFLNVIRSLFFPWLRRENNEDK